MKTLFLFLLGCIGMYAQNIPIDIQPSALPETIGIHILDQKELRYAPIDGVKVTELSDVTYDKKRQKLYFVGDRGSLFAFDAVFTEKIKKLSPLYAVKLQNKRGVKLRKWKRDSEGLTLDGKGRLLISFEGKPKIGWFHKNSIKRGRLIKKYTLPKLLRKKRYYRSKNKALESVAWHPKYGILTATEWPLRKDDKKLQTIYALGGKVWHFKAEPEARSAVTAIEVMDDGNVLVLERSYINLFSPFVITLKKVMIQHCHTQLCPTQVLVKMNSHKGWDIDNFEGLARVGKHRYVMVSDDNDNFFQKTLLIYFEVN